MLNLLDQLIQKILDAGWTSPPKPGFYFTVPDEEWRARVKNGVGERLNIYLYEVRENREFRRAEWDRVELSDRTTVLSRPPAYFDCHYLISAWSPAEDSEATSPVQDEHRLLGEALRLLMRQPEVTPATVGIPDGGPVFQQARIYLTIAPPEGQSVLKDFWTSMKLPWRPAIHLVAVAPVDLLQDSPPAPLLTTLVQRYASLGAAGEVDEWIQIGGWVLDAAAAPIAGATVQRVATGETVVTDAQGRYTFIGLRRGQHTFRAEAPGKTPQQHDLQVPDGPPEDHIFILS